MIFLSFAKSLHKKQKDKNMKLDFSPLSEPLENHGKLFLSLMLFMAVVTVAVAVTVKDVMIVALSFVAVFIVSVLLFCVIAKNKKGEENLK